MSVSSDRENEKGDLNSEPGSRKDSANDTDEIPDSLQNSVNARKYGKLGGEDTFQSGSQLLRDDPSRLQLMERVNKNEGTITSVNYQSARNLLGKSTRSKSNQSSSFLSMRFTSKSSKNLSRSNMNLAKGKGSSRRLGGSSRKLQKLQDLDAESSEALNIIETRVKDSRKTRSHEMKESFAVESENVDLRILQPLSKNKNSIITKKVDDLSLLISRGQVFGQPGGKPCQDCVAVATWDSLEVTVVCDGHGKSGEEMAYRVAKFMAAETMKRVVSLTLKCRSDSEKKEEEIFADSTDPEMLEEVFHECDDQVVWTKTLKNFTWAKIIDGEFAGLMAQITSNSKAQGEVLHPARLLEQSGREDDEDIPVTIFLNGPRKWFSTKGLGFCAKPEAIPDRQLELPVEQQMVKRKHLRCEADVFGGCTCLVIIRNKATNQVRFATAGDSRVIIVRPDSKDVDEDDSAAVVVSPRAFGLKKSFFSCMGSSGTENMKSSAILSVEHNIHDPSERARLDREHSGCFVVGDGKTNEGMEGYFFSNALFPYTGGLTPTRGFGDRLYFGSGYTCNPDISHILQLHAGDFIMGGSDGVFDDALWGDRVHGLAHEIIECLEERKSAEEIIERARSETHRRCKAWNHFRVDDISLFGVKIQ